jgi:hypothetical protein
MARRAPEFLSEGCAFRRKFGSPVADVTYQVGVRLVGDLAVLVPGSACIALAN